MIKFGLFSKFNGERINYVTVNNLEEAILYFSKMKDIDSFNLLEIFDIKKIP